MTKSNSKITCKAAVVWRAGEPLKLEEIQIEPPKSSEVRVKLLYASVCHTDILFAEGREAYPLFPRVLGHEGVGIVESIGDEVKGLEEGDYVIPTVIGQCQACENCTSPNTNLCLTYPLSRTGLMHDGTSRMSIGGEKLYHMFSCSTWSEYMVIDSSHVIKIDPSTADLPHLSILSCGFSTGFGAAWKEANVEKGSSVAVLGLGAVGLGVTKGAQMLGATKIIGIDKNSMKKEKGEVFGMTDFINPEEFNKSISQVVKDLTGGIGVDYCFECIGAEPLINEAIQATKVGKGKTIVLGGGIKSLKIDYLPLFSGRTIKGSVIGGLKVKSDLPIILDKCKNKEFCLNELLTHEIPLEDTNKMFQLLKEPDCVKVLIKISNLEQ